MIVSRQLLRKSGTRKKGLSLQQKREQILALLYESEDIAPKRKGVISQAVKEVTQSLVDDGLVECEKIGTNVCYWAFRSKASQIRKNKVLELKESISNFENKVAEGTDELKKQRKGKEASDSCSLQEEERNLKERLNKYAEYDPEAIAQVKLRTEKARDAANQWTDNIFTIKKWCKTKFGVEEKVLDQQFGVPEDMDYIE
ncbi:Mnd1 family protein [Dictyocaulus viviparus]|uniref:Meiotic nuclear division protein 1 homolog n=1 Tax=Dictyocaulus viviparus TaxID=29172 RepID=A0A0D8Y3Z4_DICVI|nr:Mnd1 family protein [Dictyocaulus viviparus]